MSSTTIYDYCLVLYFLVFALYFRNNTSNYVLDGLYKF